MSKCFSIQYSNVGYTKQFSTDGFVSLLFLPVSTCSNLSNTYFWLIVSLFQDRPLPPDVYNQVRINNLITVAMKGDCDINMKAPIIYLNKEKASWTNIEAGVKVSSMWPWSANMYQKSKPSKLYIFFYIKGSILILFL